MQYKSNAGKTGQSETGSERFQGDAGREGGFSFGTILQRLKQGLWGDRPGCPGPVLISLVMRMITLQTGVWHLLKDPVLQVMSPG